MFLLSLFFAVYYFSLRYNKDGSRMVTLSNTLTNTSCVNYLILIFHTSETLSIRFRTFFFFRYFRNEKEFQEQLIYLLIPTMTANRASIDHLIVCVRLMSLNYCNKVVYIFVLMNKTVSICLRAY